MITCTLADTDINQIAKSGQCFRMREVSDRERFTDSPCEYEMIAQDKILRVGQSGNSFSFACSHEEFEKFWRDYFDLSTDYSEIKRLADAEDVFLNKAIEFGAGIRILRQDLWEMIVTFIISQQNNIPRIAKCIDNICRRYGRELANPYGGVYYSFPTADVLAKLEEDALMECNLGYRSKYVVRVAKEVAEGKLNLEELRAMNYQDARKRLLGLYGVGVKVADCISLFGLHFIDAFPVDTHIKQIIEREYPDGFPLERYDGYAGIIQQYIFYYEINNK